MTANQYKLRAFNYATESTNRIHGDQAEAYGFKGGLVPGICVYAYLTRPVVEAWGKDWLERGSMNLRLLHPVYDGDEVTVTGNRTGETEMDLEARDSERNVCAKASASIDRDAPPLSSAAYVRQGALGLRYEPSIQMLKVGSPLTDLELKLDLALAQRTFNRDVRSELEIYDGTSGACHPALLLAQANYILRNNINLGPWIHAASEVRNYAMPRDGELLSLRGKIAEAYEKKGHEFVTADLGMFGDNARPIAHFRHTAIIRPRMKDC